MDQWDDIVRHLFPHERFHKGKINQVRKEMDEYLDPRGMRMGSGKGSTIWSAIFWSTISTVCQAAVRSGIS